ncbi:ABC transporter substrate-binding protein [Kribbella sp. NPDC059898]|uniref:ABC transporter substrate-binding protein n=1 Tax=Kribbella sp. NPDC059898 TaxID=3346995 RepID=UPI00365D3775
MRVRKKAFGAIAAGLAGLLALGACGGGQGTNAGGSEANGKVKLEWTLWAAGADEQAQWKHIADLVTKEHPDITVELRTGPFADYFTKLKTQLAGGQAPCLVTMQSLRLPTFASALEPLDSAIPDFKPADWDKGSLEAMKSDGKQLGLPYGFATMLMYYNRDAFDKAGVPLPKPGWTTADFEAAAKKLTTPGKPGFGLSFSDLHMFSMLQAYNGARPVDDSGKVQLTTPEMKDAFTWYSGLATKQKVANVPASSSDVPWGEQQFVAGNAAMAVDGTWNLGSNTKAAKFRLGVAPLPAGPAGLTSYVADSGFAISKACKYKDAAAKALAVMTGPEAQTYLAGQGRSYPARTAVVDTYKTFLSSQVGAKNPDLAAAAISSLQASFTKTTPFIASGNWDQVTKKIAQNFLPAYTGATPPDQALQTVQQQSQGS